MHDTICNPTVEEYDWYLEFKPRVLPADWREMHNPSNGFANRRLGLMVMLSIRREMDGKRWAHLSISHRATNGASDRTPTWDEMMNCKRIFFGPSRLAVQIAPPDDEYVNICSHVLHLWTCLDGERIVPDFRIKRDNGTWEI